jgi:surface antigen
MTVSLSSRALSYAQTIAKSLPVLALAAGMGLTPSFSAQAQSHGGGGHDGGGGGGGYHGGGGYRGGGYGGGYHGYRGWGGWYGPGFYPGFGFDSAYGYGYGYGIGGYDPFWYEGSAPLYAEPPVVTYAQPTPPQYYPPDVQSPPPPQNMQGAYNTQSPYNMQSSGMATNFPTDNSRGFYIWPVGIQGGTCNRAYLAQTASNLTGLSPVALQSGARLGGIAINPLIGGRVGSHLDIIDQACATEALEHAGIGSPVSWHGADGTPVTLRVTKSESPQNGKPCRNYETTAQIGSRTEKTSARACRDAATGTWQAFR